MTFMAEQSVVQSQLVTVLSNMNDKLTASSAASEEKRAPRGGKQVGLPSGGCVAQRRLETAGQIRQPNVAALEASVCAGAESDGRVSGTSH